MAVTNWSSPASAVKTGGTWGSESANNFLTQDGLTVVWAGGPPVSVRLTNFAFSDLPSGATIDGIEIRFYGREVGNGNAYADQIFLQKVAGTNVGTNQGGTSATFLVQSTSQWHVWGGSTNLFGTTWTRAELQSTGFSLHVRFSNYDVKYSPELYADAFQARVYYTEASSPPVVTNDSATGTAGTSGTKQMSATNTPTSWSLPYSPPTGVTINNSGLISWNTSTSAGSYSISVAAFNAGGSGLGTLSLTMNTPNPPTVLNPAILTGVIGTTFFTTISGTGSPTSYNAVLPSWLQVHSITGLVSGLPPVGSNKKIPLIFYAIDSNGSGSKDIVLNLSKSTEASGFFTKAKTSRPYSQGGKTIFTGGTIIYQSGNLTATQPRVANRLDQIRYYN